MSFIHGFTPVTLEVGYKRPYFPVNIYEILIKMNSLVKFICCLDKVNIYIFTSGLEHVIVLIFRLNRVDFLAKILSLNCLNFYFSLITVPEGEFIFSSFKSIND